MTGDGFFSGHSWAVVRFNPLVLYAFFLLDEFWHLHWRAFISKMSKGTALTWNAIKQSFISATTYTRLNAIDCEQTLRSQTAKRLNNLNKSHLFFQACVIIFFWMQKHISESIQVDVRSALYSTQHQGHLTKTPHPPSSNAGPHALKDQSRPIQGSCTIKAPRL